MPGGILRAGKKTGFSSAVSWNELEGQSDMMVSTLHKVMKAMGGELEITVRFPRGRVRLKQFGLPPVAAK